MLPALQVWLLFMVVLVPSAAAAAPGALMGAPTPSWQTNGTVWALAAANGAIYLGGDFTSVRPPGAPLGTDEVPRNHLAAFDAATGELLPFNPDLDATVKALVAAPDGSKVYAGGDFRSVGGKSVGRLAAFDTTTGELIAGWKAKAWAGVRALEVYGDTVYIGGMFSMLNNQPRNRLAAVDAETGALRPWAPIAERTIWAISAADDGSRVYVGGNFDFLNGQAQHAVAALDPTTGSLLPFPAASAIPPTTLTCESVVKDLTTDADMVYAAAEGTGGGCFDGTFAANVSDGTLKWRNICRGATQAVEVLAGYLYKGSHAHDCSSVPGGFPEVEKGQSYHLLAQHLDDGLLGTWYPNTDGKPLGPRVLATDGQRLFVGGDFGAVNHKTQQGFAFFESGPGIPPLRPTAPVVASVEPGTAEIEFTATWDRDDNDLTYSLLRDDDLTPIETWQVSSTPWSKPVVSARDEGLEPGSTHTYRVQVTDGVSTLKSPFSAPVTVATTPASYAEHVLTDFPSFYWRLGELSGTTAADATGSGRSGIYAGGVTRGLPGPFADDPDRAVAFDGYGGRVSSSSRAPAPQTFSAEAWFRTSTTRGGKILGFGNRQSGSSTNYDRHVYMRSSGQLTFGVWVGRAETITTPAPYNDGAWHHVVATLGPAGMVLYVDGAPVGGNPTTAAQAYSGYWRVGGDNLFGWPGRPTSAYFRGLIDEAAVYGRALTPNQVAAHYSRAG